jgi:glycosyltransferase involved in cell wall biosynthesis
LEVSAGDLIVNQNTLLYIVENNLLKHDDLKSLRCLFTHAAEISLKQGNLIQILLKLNKILVLNESDKVLLISYGIPTKSIVVVYGGIDRNRYYPSLGLPRKKFVLITGDAKSRKNPEKIVQLVTACSTINFVICGRYWAKYLKSRNIYLPNLKVLNYESKLNEKLMRDASVFITLSHQEGGPYPVLEALASGTPVISTPVGWSPEIINNANGRLIEFETDIEVIRDLILTCIDLKSVVYSKDLLNGRFSWYEFAKLLYED